MNDAGRIIVLNTPFKSVHIAPLLACRHLLAFRCNLRVNKRLSESNDSSDCEESNLQYYFGLSLGGRSEAQFVPSSRCAHGVGYGKRHTQLCLNCSSQGVACVIIGGNQWHGAHASAAPLLCLPSCPNTSRRQRCMSESLYWLDTINEQYVRTHLQLLRCDQSQHWYIVMFYQPV